MRGGTRSARASPCTPPRAPTTAPDLRPRASRPPALRTASPATAADDRARPGPSHARLLRSSRARARRLRGSRRGRGRRASRPTRPAAPSRRARASSRAARRSAPRACRADQAVHEHRLALPEAVHTVGRLLLDGRVPPAVEVEDVVRRRQVEAAAAGADRDDEDRRPVLASRTRSAARRAAARSGGRGRSRPSAPSRSARYGTSRSKLGYCVKTSALSSAGISSQQLDQPLELPRAARRAAAPVCSSISGWLHTCFRWPSIASTAPRRPKRSSCASIRGSQLSTVAW